MKHVWGPWLRSAAGRKSPRIVRVCKVCRKAQWATFMGGPLGMYCPDNNPGDCTASPE
jgi:hypothetical protein